MIDAKKWGLLAEKFPAEEVRFRAGVVRGNRALALAYIDARTVMEKLDEVLGVDGWQDSYRVLKDGAVVCTLRCRVGVEGEWITKSDVGSPSEQPDEGDRRKAAFSDALKRAAVKFGVGRYLYRLPQVWVDYDEHKKRLVQKPTLPAWALLQEQTISDEQVRELAALLQETHTDPGRFCAHFHIQEAQALPARCFEEAVATLKKKRQVVTV